jgi:hypothetical protein
MGLTRSSSNLYHPFACSCYRKIKHVSKTTDLDHQPREQNATACLGAMKGYNKRAGKAHIDTGGVMPPSHVSVVVADSIQAIMDVCLLALVEDICR